MYNDLNPITLIAMFNRLRVMLAMLPLILSWPAAATENVRDHGAKGDGSTKDTAAIQAAIDAATQAGGGVVVIPPGRYISGTIHLKSNVTLYISPGATLAENPDNSDFDPYETLTFRSVSDVETTYFHYALVTAENVHNIAIVGEGTIDGNRLSATDQRRLRSSYASMLRSAVSLWRTHPTTRSASGAAITWT